LEPPASAFFRPFNRYLNRADDAATSSAFVDFGDRGTQIIISRGNNIVFLKRHALGGFELDQRVAERLELPVEDAAALRRQHLFTTTDVSDTSRSSEILDAIQPALDQLGKEIALCLRYCAVTFRGDRPSNIVCGGSEAGSKRQLQNLSRVTEIPILPADPLRGVSVGALSLLADGQVPAEWTTAVGLALKSRRRSQVEKAVA
jgi:type IV pilus assembly protein PilM